MLYVKYRACIKSQQISIGGRKFKETGMVANTAKTQLYLSLGMERG